MRPELGYPLKLLVPGSEGTRNIKWLRRIKVTDQPQMTNYEIKCYANWQKSDGKGRWFQFEMEPGGVIIYPSGEQQLNGRGFYEISGIAWSGGGSVHQGRSIHRWRQGLEGREASGPGASKGAHAVPYGLGLGRKRICAHVPHHG